MPVSRRKYRYRASAANRLRAILASEFTRRRRINPRYSLRAFARSVEIEHSTLSQLLRGKRTLTWKSIRLLAGRMRWTGTAILRYWNADDKFDSRHIARELGVSVDEVNVALTDLCLFGLIELKGE
jgi:transcriptional regulator with XRE-family HTH domain